MEEYDKMLAAEYHYHLKDSVSNERMKKLQEKARIELESYNAIPNSDYELNHLALNQFPKNVGRQ